MVAAEAAVTLTERVGGTTYQTVRSVLNVKEKTAFEIFPKKNLK